MDTVLRALRSHIHFALVALLCALLGTSVSAAEAMPSDPAVWETYRSPEGRFSVRIPERPQLIPLSRPTIMGPIYGSKYKVEMGESHVSVSFMDLPAIAIFVLPSSSILNKARTGIVEELDGKLGSSHDLIHQGYPARAFRYAVSDPEARSEEVLLVLVDSRLYIIIASRPMPAQPDDLFANLFQTFQVWPE
jgi:hypothetical protein